LFDRFMELHAHDFYQALSMFLCHRSQLQVELIQFFCVYHV
jgi:hypothetical protein